MQQQMQPAGAVYAVAATPGVVSRPPTSTEPSDPFRIAITYTATLDDRAKYLGCTFGGAANPWGLCGATCCDICCWDKKLKNRAYVSVHENRIESNYPTTCCLGMLVCDRTYLIYFDQIGSAAKADGSCTPFHCCYCIELCGGVVAFAPFDALNNCCCNCCRTFYPGIADPAGFATAIQGARMNFEKGQRSGPAAHQSGPGRVIMA